MAGAAYGYDANGNTTSDATRHLAYGENRLVSVAIAGVATTYAYGPDGSRIKTVDASGTSFLLGAELEVDPSGIRTKLPHPDVRRIGTANCFVHRDHLATIKAETDATGAVGLRNRYTAYGETIPVTATSCGGEARTYLGDRRDAGTGLMDLHARWYDPALGRFLSPDWQEPVDIDAASHGNPAGWLANAVGTNRTPTPLTIPSIRRSQRA